MFSAIGWITNSAIGWLLPGLGPKVLYAGAAALVVALCSSWAYFQGVEGKGAAVARCEASCLSRMAQKETAYQRTLTEILQDVQEGEEPAPKTQTDLDEACKRSSMCRENR